MSNQQINIQFPDGSNKAYQAGVLASDVAKSISQSLYKEAVVCRMNDRLVDLTHPLQEDCELTFYTLKDQEGLNVMRHSPRLSTSTYSIISRCKINNRSCH